MSAAAPSCAPASPAGAKPSQHRPVLKVIVIGDSAVGKSSLLNRFVAGSFDQRYKATVGADFFTHDVKLTDGTEVTLQLWDTAGQERFRALGTAFYRGADACMLAYDITSEESFKRLFFWYTEFQRHCDDASVMIVGNKSDLSDRRVVTVAQVEQFCRDNDRCAVPLMPDATGDGATSLSTLTGMDWATNVYWPFVETSAKDNVAVEGAFRTVAEVTLKKKSGEAPPEKVKSVQLTHRSVPDEGNPMPGTAPGDTKKRFGCC